MKRMESWQEREKRVVRQTDGHYCFDWDGLAVSAWTTEYDCCTDFRKSPWGEMINYFVMLWFNLNFWWQVGRKRDDDPLT